MKLIKLLSLLAIISGVLSCKKHNPKRIIDQRDFKMGFSTWSFGPQLQDVNDTYDFIFENGDIYSEQVDNVIPWEAWINDTDLPADFVSGIEGRVSKKPNDKELVLSISLLNTNRTDIIEGYNGKVPVYEKLNDSIIEEAYYKHLVYLAEKFSPKYMVLAMETNELLNKSQEKWDEYKMLMANIRTRIRIKFPGILISESVTLHHWFQPDVSNPTDYIKQISNYYNQLDFVAVSYYPFFKNQHNRKEFQEAFDFLNQQANKPIAIIETNHLANDLDVESLNLHITSDEKEQNEYLETVLINAHENQYKFVIWWAHRDYDALWETFPENVKEVGKLWRDTGLKDESDKGRKALKTWEKIYAK